MQPDSLIPDPSNPQAWNRYAYVLNNPIRYNDPTGHDSIVSEFLAGAASEIISSVGWFIPPLQVDLAPQENESAAMLAGRIVGDIVSMAIGVGLMNAGAGAITGGAGCAALTAGGCAPVTAGAAVAGGALALEGAGASVRGAVGLGANLYLMAKKISNVQKNKQAGDNFRDEIADSFEQNGYTVRKEVVKKTPFGKRIIDVEIVSPDGKLLGGIEAKVGNSRYLPSQRAKDFWLKTKGYIVNLLRKK